MTNQKRRINIIAAFLVSCNVSLISHAQKMPETNSVYAAGYKAAFTCSALFNNHSNRNKNLTQISQQELSGIYTEYQSLVDSLPDAVINRDNFTVSVAFDSTLPPRISIWRPHLGCVQLPPGASIDDKSLLPSITISKPRDNINDPWKQFAPINGPTGHKRLDTVVNGAFKGAEFNQAFGKDAFTTAILIATPTEIIAEQYIDGYDNRTSQRTWSVAKSLSATVIGAAVQQKLIDVKQPTGISAWQHPIDPRRNLTVEHLLHMNSGLDSDRAGSRTDRLYLGGGSVVDTAVKNSLEQKPNTRWKYANNDTLLAMRSLRETMKNDQAYLKFPFEQVLYKIGMLDTYLETDWNGDFIMSSQVWTTSRDMARLGILYLNNGVWNGERILPDYWAKYVATPAPAQPVAGPTGYGAQFWLYNKQDNEHFSNIPNDAYAAHGNRGQYLMIIPSKNLLIVRRGHDPARGRGFDIGAFTDAVLGALQPLEE